MIVKEAAWKGRGISAQGPALETSFFNYGLQQTLTASWGSMWNTAPPTVLYNSQQEILKTRVEFFALRNTWLLFENESVPVRSQESSGRRRQRDMADDRILHGVVNQFQELRRGGQKGRGMCGGFCALECS